jgi:hypothetical protein
MTKKLTKKLTTLLKNATQNEAVLTFLLDHNTLTSIGAREAGVSDPRRVVNHLRNAGFPIQGNQVVNRAGQRLTQYALAQKASAPVAIIKASKSRSNKA